MHIEKIELTARIGRRSDGHGVERRAWGASLALHALVFSGLWLLARQVLTPPEPLITPPVAMMFEAPTAPAPAASAVAPLPPQTPPPPAETPVPAEPPPPTTTAQPPPAEVPAETPPPVAVTPPPPAEMPAPAETPAPAPTPPPPPVKAKPPAKKLVRPPAQPAQSPAAPQATPAAPPANPSSSATTEAAPLIPPHPVEGMQSNHPPVYPLSARKRGEQGRVLLRVKVSAEGAPTGVEVARSSGSDALDRSASAAAGEWRFVPATRGGMPVAATAEVAIQFRLTD